MTLYYVNLLLNMFRMLIQPSSGACDYLVRYCVGCIVENASYKISYRRFTVSFLHIYSMPFTELLLQLPTQ